MVTPLAVDAYPDLEYEREAAQAVSYIKSQETGGGEFRVYRPPTRLL